MSARRLAVATLTVTLLGASVCPPAAFATDPPFGLLQGLFRGRAVTYALLRGQPVFEGDILLDHVTAIPHGAPNHAVPQSVGVAYGPYLWPITGGVAQIPYIVTAAATQLNNAISAFNTTFSGIIQFVPRTTQADYVNFDFDPSNQSGQCESSVGHVGGEQFVQGSGSCSLGTLLHEMGHVVGLYHEMSRPDRNTYLTVNLANVIKGSEDNFTQLSDNFQDLGPFDYGSVMMYIPFAFSRNGGPVLETIPAGMPLSNLSGYTAADIDGVKRLYGGAPTQVTIATNPPGLAVTVDGAPVTTPQSYAWKLRSKHTLAASANAQTLGGGTYTFGRWNNATTASQTVTILPGSNTLAQPNTAPAVTVYTANFIQLSATTTTAYPASAGSVAISPAPQSYPGATGLYTVARQPVTITPTPTGAYQFVTWGGTSAPFSANPKPDYVPDGAQPWAITGYFSTQPITTITTTPGGFYFMVDGNYYKGPQGFTQDLFSNWAVGSKHTITALTPSQPYSINTRYTFKAWSDGGASSHTITVPKTATTRTGIFTAAYVPIAYAQPSCAATIALSPTSPDGFYASGTAVKIAATAAAGWDLTGWTGDLKGRLATQTLKVNDEKLAVANYNATTTAFATKSLSPSRLAAGSAGATIKILGTGFSAGNAVFVNNLYRASAFVSSTELDVGLVASDLASAGAFPIGVSSFPANAPCGAYGSLGFFVTR